MRPEPPAVTLIQQCFSCVPPFWGQFTTQQRARGWIIQSTMSQAWLTCHKSATINAALLHPRCFFRKWWMSYLTRGWHRSPAITSLSKSSTSTSACLSNNFDHQGKAHSIALSKKEVGDIFHTGTEKQAAVCLQTLVNILSACTGLYFICAVSLWAMAINNNQSTISLSAQAATLLIQSGHVWAAY